MYAARIFCLFAQFFSSDLSSFYLPTNLLPGNTINNRDTPGHAFRAAVENNFHSKIHLKPKKQKRRETPASIVAEAGPKSADISHMLAKGRFGSIVKQSSPTNTPPALPKQQRLIGSQKQKNQVLDNYQATYGKDPKVSIITKQKGEHWQLELPTQFNFVKRKLLRHDPTQGYRTIDISLDSILPNVLMQSWRNSPKWLRLEDILALRSTSTRVKMATDVVIEYANVDYRPILDWSGGMRDQNAIQRSRMAMATSLFLHAGARPGNMV